MSNERCSRQDIPHRERFELGWDYFLSAAPQAEPQAAGFSFGLSAAPQAAGFSSGLSAAPQADVEASLSVVPHPDRLESAISISSLQNSRDSRGAFCALFAFYEMAEAFTSTHFFVTYGPSRPSFDSKQLGNRLFYPRSFLAELSPSVARSPLLKLPSHESLFIDL
nr:hypothetical protein [uncultured Fretibacterium sp.]